MHKGIVEGMFSSSSVEWSTPQWLFDELDNEFHFTLDPCSTHENHKCDKYYTETENGLLQDWQGETVYCNPPMESRSLHGLKSATGKALRTTQQLSC